MAAHNRNQPVVIAGAGPAGSSLAIRLAERGLPVVLVERESFPRQKLCGEFISPECLLHFDRLGVLPRMLDAGGDRISETVFYSLNGSSISVKSGVFGSDALSLSRLVMDSVLLDRAKELGVKVYENAVITAIETSSTAVENVEIKSAIGGVTVSPRLLVDATGRSGAVAKLAARRGSSGTRSKPENARLVGFKAHLRDADLPKGRCEIYSFRGGYGGLSNIESGFANHCFLVRAELVKRYRSADAIVENVIWQNPRARHTLNSSVRVDEWLAVSVSRFGTQDPAPQPGLLTVGDSAAFIDPFTGSGMLMALESSEILSRSILDHPNSPAHAARAYKKVYRSHFRRRLAVCGILRYAAFVPGVASAVIRALSASDSLRSYLARATRPARQANL